MKRNNNGVIVTAKTNGNKGGRPRKVHPDKVRDLLAVTAILLHFAKHGEVPDGTLTDWAQESYKTALAETMTK